MSGSKLQCANTTCLPFTTIIVPSIWECQKACLGDIYCRAASFHTSSTSCQLFADISDENDNMLADIDIITMIVVSGTRVPPG
ncbi:unnamed protein product [Adineta steineri]|nr:unnamed protein product [Adineta steineri]